MRSEARPGRVGGYALKAPLLGVPGGPGGRGVSGTQAGGSNTVAAMETGRRFNMEKVKLRRRGDQGESGLDAGVELAERGATRAVMDFLGRLHGCIQPKPGWAPGAGVSSYLAGRRPLGGISWFVPLALEWARCKTHAESTASG
jgi:hypothetical protein